VLQLVAEQPKGVTSALLCRKLDQDRQSGLRVAPQALIGQIAGEAPEGRRLAAARRP
jgi:hypothetical protein